MIALNPLDSPTPHTAPTPTTCFFSAPHTVPLFLLIASLLLSRVEKLMICSDNMVDDADGWMATVEDDPTLAAAVLVSFTRTAADVATADLNTARQRGFEPGKESAPRLPTAVKWGRKRQRSRMVPLVGAEGGKAGDSSPVSPLSWGESGCSSSSAPGSEATGRKASSTTTTVAMGVAEAPAGNGVGNGGGSVKAEGRMVVGCCPTMTVKATVGVAATGGHGVFVVGGTVEVVAGTLEGQGQARGPRFGVKKSKYFVTNGKKVELALLRDSVMKLEEDNKQLRNVLEGHKKDFENLHGANDRLKRLKLKEPLSGVTEESLTLDDVLKPASDDAVKSCEEFDLQPHKRQCLPFDLNVPLPVDAN